MQYIQLQGQIAAELDLPIVGGYNLFIDESDNSIKAKDSDGNITGGGNSLVEITKSNLDIAIEDATLIPGTFYKITGVSSGSSERYIQEGGTTIILQAATPTSLNPKGIGLFWNPNYYNPNNDLGEYQVWTNTFEFTLDRNITGQFFDMEETILLDAPCNMVLRPNIIDNTAIVTLTDWELGAYFTGSANYPILFESDNTAITGSLIGVQSYPIFNVGSKVIYGGRIWQNVNGYIGNTNGEFELDTQEWQVVPYNSTDYNLVADIIEYDYQNDCICYRKDVVHNVEVISNYEHLWDVGDPNGIRRFPWGHPQVYGVTLENTATENLVNFPITNVINELHMKHGSRFEANYWGRNNQFRNIFGDCDSDIESLSLGKWATFNRIRLGINSTIGGGGTLFIVGNDGDTITDITMGTNSDIYSMNMYQYSYLDEITIETNARISDMTMYDESHINDLDMSLNSRLEYITIGSNSQIYDVNFDASSYIANLNIDSNASINNISLGRNSYIDYSSVGLNCQLYDIRLGIDSYMNCNNLGNTNGFSSNINSITLGDNSYASGINLYGGTYISNINGSNNVSFNGLTITGSNSYIADFEIEQNGGFGGFTIDGSQGSVNMSQFKLGQNNGFGGISDVTSSMSDITIERAFNNFEASKFIAGVTASFSPGFSWADTNTLDSLDTNKSFQILDTAGWDASTTTLNYYLADGDYEGQTIKFFLSQDEGNSIYNNAGNLRIWMNAFTQNFNLVGSITQLPWYPFSSAGSMSTLRKDIPQCIWLNGKWVIDNDQWD